MVDQQELSFFVPRLESVTVTEFGAGVTLVARGTSGDVTLRCEPVDRYLHCPAVNPCVGCIDAPRCDGITGCPCAEAWNRVAQDYAAKVRP